MDLRVVALYPGRLSSLSGRAGVRFRRQKKGQSTLVPCQVRALDGQSVASPDHQVPEGTPAPRFKAQFETLRMPVDERRVVHIVLSADSAVWKSDPEQILLSPIFDDGHRLLFEFQRAYILIVRKNGELETRLVVVHPVLGVIGTQTIYRFNTRLSGLANRCAEYLAGAVELFPIRDRPVRPSDRRLPPGEANLNFADPDRPSRRLTTDD